MTPVAVTGMGAVSCAGRAVSALWNSVKNNKSAVKNGLGLLDSGRDPIKMAEFALQEAMKQAGWSELNDDDGLILATTTGQVYAWEEPLIAFFKNGDRKIESVFAKQPLGSLLDETAANLNFKGKKLLLSSACSASTQALGIAALWVSTGMTKRCLVGGIETLSKLTIEGFRSLQLLSPEVCAPFDEKRKGINLSEGAGFLCIEKSSKNSLGFISGFGFATDAHHLTAPHPEGRGSFIAMKNALRMSGISNSEIDWAHLHGTGSLANDLTESAAMKALFGEHQPYASSTKGIHGHALGASGAIETVICLRAMSENYVPVTYGLQNPDPRISIRHSPGCSMEIKYVLKNTLGFGGNNAALILSRGVAR